MINSPCNPTGAVYSREEIAEIVEIAVENDLWIISDEIYSRLIWNGVEHVSPATIEGGAERTIVISGWSKNLGDDRDACRFLNRAKHRSKSRLEMSGQLRVTYTHIHDGSGQSCA